MNEHLGNGICRAPSEVRGISASGSYTTRRSYSREPSVTVTISTGPSWRRSLSRETSRDSDSTSVAYEPQTSSTSMTAPHSATSRSKSERASERNSSQNDSSTSSTSTCSHSNDNDNNDGDDENNEQSSENGSAEAGDEDGGDEKESADDGQPLEIYWEEVEVTDSEEESD